MYYLFHDPSSKTYAFVITCFTNDTFYTQRHTLWQPTVMACLSDVTQDFWACEAINYLDTSYTVIYSGEKLPTIATHPELFL